MRVVRPHSFALGLSQSYSEPEIGQVIKTFKDKGLYRIGSILFYILLQTVKSDFISFCILTALYFINADLHFIYCALDEVKGNPKRNAFVCESVLAFFFCYPSTLA